MQTSRVKGRLRGARYADRVVLRTTFSEEITHLEDALYPQAPLWCPHGATRGNEPGGHCDPRRNPPTPAPRGRGDRSSPKLATMSTSKGSPCGNTSRKMSHLTPQNEPPDQCTSLPDAAILIGVAARRCGSLAVGAGFSPYRSEEGTRRWMSSQARTSENFFESFREARTRNAPRNGRETFARQNRNRQREKD